MELSLSSEDAAFRDEVRAFIAGNYPQEMRVLASWTPAPGGVAADLLGFAFAAFAEPRPPDFSKLSPDPAIAPQNKGSEA